MTVARTFPATRGLSVASLEIGRVLADRDGVTFRAQGTCMYPTIRPGDVLRIRSCKARDVAVGEIAVCRSRDYLFSHRVIAKGDRDGRAFVVTRSDRGSGEGDAPTFDENLLGVVVSATRNGQPVPLQATRQGLPGRMYHAARLAILEITPWLRAVRADLLGTSGGMLVQQVIARAWFTLSRPPVRIVVRVPLNSTLGGGVFRQLGPEEFDPEQGWNDRATESWTLAALVGDAHEPAAWSTFARDPGRSWKIIDSHVRRRYRGLGFDRMILDHAGRITGRAT